MEKNKKKREPLHKEGFMLQFFSTCFSSVTQGNILSPAFWFRLLAGNLRRFPHYWK